MRLDRMLMFAAEAGTAPGPTRPEGDAVNPAGDRGAQGMPNPDAVKDTAPAETAQSPFTNPAGDQGPVDAGFAEWDPAVANKFAETVAEGEPAPQKEATEVPVPGEDDQQPEQPETKETQPEQPPSETPAKAEEAGSDDKSPDKQASEAAIQRVLAKYQKSPEQLAKGYVNLVSKLGQQGSELGELRSRVEDMARKADLADRYFVYGENGAEPTLRPEMAMRSLAGAEPPPVPVNEALALREAEQEMRQLLEKAGVLEDDIPDALTRAREEIQHRAQSKIERQRTSITAHQEKRAAQANEKIAKVFQENPELEQVRGELKDFVFAFPAHLRAELILDGSIDIYKLGALFETSRNFEKALREAYSLGLSQQGPGLTPATGSPPSAGQRAPASASLQSEDQDVKAGILRALQPLESIFDD